MANTQSFQELVYRVEDVLSYELPWMNPGKMESWTELDIRDGFLPSDGASARIPIFCYASTCAIWILSGRDERRGQGIEKIFFASERDGLLWVLDLGKETRGLPDRVYHIYQAIGSGNTKYVVYRDGSVGIWRSVASWEEILVIPGSVGGN